jgi:hypothetical protein
MSDNSDLYKRKFRYWGNGRTGIANDSFTARQEAARAAGMSPVEARAYQTSSGPITTTSTPLITGPGITAQPIDPATGQSKTTYGGVPAMRIDIAYSNLNIQPGFSMTNPIDQSETGVLIGFMVAVNDPAFVINAQIYGDNGSSTTLWNDTVEACTYLGRGLTHTQATAVTPGKYQYSVDAMGTKDDIWPWIRRYRNSLSLYALQNSLSQADVVGTSDDIWLVMDYTPATKEGYSRVTLNVSNGGSNVNGQILRMQLSRIKFQPTVTPVYTSATGDYAHAYEAQEGEEMEMGGDDFGVHDLL